MTIGSNTMKNKPKIALVATLAAALFTSAAFAADKVHLNQVGFGANAQKQAVYNGTPTGTITIRSVDGGKVNQTITPEASKTWEYSGEATNRLLDFSSVKTPGNYALYENGNRISPPFKIGVSYDKLTRDALRFYYLKRVDKDIENPYAEGFTRAAGYSNRNAIIYDVNGTSTGKNIPSHRGWYDAGDYGRYVPNSGMSVYTLLALYEKYHDKIPALNIPLDDIIVGLPDLLSEIKWNLDWMLTMQDAADGGVYHKMTTQDFNYKGPPSGDNGQLMVMWKTTAATLDFAAVMAVASRIYRDFDETYADKMLTAAKKAWNWAKNNPIYCYNRNPEYPSTCDNKSNDPTKTGAYEDNDVNDEFFFAAVALATVTDATEHNSLGLFEQMDKSLNDNKQTWNPTGHFSGAASWQVVGTLGSYEIIRNKDKFPIKYYNDALNVLAGNTDWMLAENENGYGLPFGNIFWWGSNSNIANTGILFMELYETTKDIKYKNAAQATFDYILGRNPLDLSYVTGYGNKRVSHIHDRMTESWSWGIFPGQVVGGASSQGCTGNGKTANGTALSGTALATFYEDKDGCYGYNEICINWNAPLAYLSAALSEPGSDIEKIELVTKIDDFANGSNAGITEGEYWFNFIVGRASIGNEDEVLNSSGYAELTNINLSKYTDDWLQASIALQTTNNGVLYDLSQCSDGFRYKYNGNAHRFSLESSKGGLTVTHYKDIVSTSNWTPPVPVNSFVRDPYDEANCYGGSPCSTKETIPLDLSKVKEIHWTVRPSDAAVTGYLQIKDFECLGLLTVFESAAEKTCLDAGKVWESGVCKTPVPIRLPQIAGTRKILAYTTSNSIVLQNLPSNARVEVYNLQGKRTYSAYPENPKILRMCLLRNVEV